MLQTAKQWLFETPMAGNELWRLVAFFAVVLAGFVVGKIAKHVLSISSAELKKRNRLLASVTLEALGKSVGFVSFAISLSLASSFLVLASPKVRDLANTVCNVLVTISFGWTAYALVDVLSQSLQRIAKRTSSKMDDMLVPLVRKSLRVTVVVLTLLQVATMVSDKPLTSLIAGLGVASIAISLASQDTVKNFFGSVVLLADKPFEVGERITVDSTDGSVEEVGFRSTRVRTLDGHLVTIPNGELANKTIKNISRRPFIKRVMNVTITYDTPPEKVARAVEIVKDLLANHEGMPPDMPPRVCFNDFNNCSLNILVIYWYAPPDYWAYMAFSERFNHDLFRRFGEEGIDFAFPTQTTYLVSDPARPLFLSAPPNLKETSA